MPSTNVVMGTKRSPEKTETIRVSEKVARMLNVICLTEHTSTSEVASPILEKAIKSRYLQALTKLHGEPKEFGIS